MKLHEEENINFEQIEGLAKAISISPLSHGNKTEAEIQVLLKLQLKMATSSINHEYARLEFDQANELQRREELLEYMTECRTDYFDARDKLKQHDSQALEDFERDLIFQKKQTLSQYNA